MADHHHSGTPASVFGPEADLPLVMATLQALPGVTDLTADAGPEDWTEIRLGIASPDGERRLVVRQSPEYHARPAFDRQVQGMQGLYGGMTDDWRVLGRLASLDMLDFAVSVSGDGQDEPHLDLRDPAGVLLAALARGLDGIIFSGSFLFDADFNVLLGSQPDADATPPSWMPNPPDEAAILRRAELLAALGHRAALEAGDGAVDERDGVRRELLEWVTATGAIHDLDPREDVLSIPVGRLDAQQAVNAEWRVEGLAVLAWAVGLVPRPSDDDPADPGQLSRAIAHLDLAGRPAVVSSLRRAPIRDVAAARNHWFFLDWRFVDQRVNARHFDFGAFGQSCWFGSFGPDEFRLVEGDLAVGDRPIHAADPELLRLMQSATLERHQAIDWVWEGGTYVDVTPNT